MSHTIREVREQTVSDNSVDTYEDSDAAEYTMTILERIVYFIGSFIMVIIALRIVLSIMGANTTNAFASFIYDICYPFVAPFFGLFNYKTQYGVSRFEFESLIALIVWGFITMGVAKLVTLGSHRAEV